MTSLLLAPAVAQAQVASQPARPTQAPPSGVQGPARPGATGAPSGAATGMPISSDYTIGPDDVLGIVFWKDAEMTQDVTVRPDGNITLPLIRDIRAVGLKPEELREIITKAAAKFIADPNVTVVVRQINSRNVFVMGQVTRPGNFPVSGEMRVLQVLAVAGGLTEYANGKKISITRNENGKQSTFFFNYNDVAKGKNLNQNIVLKPGDTVVVP